MSAIVDAVRVYATLGEVSDAMRRGSASSRAGVRLERERRRREKILDRLHRRSARTSSSTAGRRPRGVAP